MTWISCLRRSWRKDDHTVAHFCYPFNNSRKENSGVLLYLINKSCRLNIMRASKPYVERYFQWLYNSTKQLPPTQLSDWTSWLLKEVGTKATPKSTFLMLLCLLLWVSPVISRGFTRVLIVSSPGCRHHSEQQNVSRQTGRTGTPVAQWITGTVHDAACCLFLCHSNVQIYHRQNTSEGLVHSELSFWGCYWTATTQNVVWVKHFIFREGFIGLKKTSCMDLFPFLKTLQTCFLLSTVSFGKTYNFRQLLSC